MRISEDTYSILISSSTWISDGIITNKMETTIACTTNHLTTFAVTQVITITSNSKI